ncbi:Sterile alpha motif domain [Trinorchestia longiramus]|nr:Sterile alpha motif domain [Trinorchestia longiramus]
MTNLAILGPVHSSGHPHHWASVDQYKQESWRELSSPSSECDMPDTSSPSPTSKSPSSVPSASRGPKRSQAKDKSRKPVEDKHNERASDQLRDTSVQASPAHARSPSVSPKSPSVPHSQTASTLSSNSPHPDFSPAALNPTCFSPLPMGGIGGMPGLPGALGAMGLFGGETGRNPANAMPRSCSDLMRSMAAKYNNNSNSNSPLQFYNSTSLNGFHRPPLPAVAFSTAGFLPSLPNESSSTPVQPQRSIESQIKTPDSSPKRAAPNGLTTGLPQHLLSPSNFPGLGTNPLLDLSSTQVLINMVRNASTLHHNQLPKTSTDIHSQQQFQKHLLLQQQQQLHQQQLLQHKDKLQHLQKQMNSDASRQNDKNSEGSRGTKRPAQASSPLDLSSSVPSKYARISESDINVEDDDTPIPRSSPAVSISPVYAKSEPITRHKYSFETKEDSLTWTVDDVYDFVRSIDICAEYAENFRDQRIDGACLILLSESHLTGSLKMKLGPALKLRSFLAARNPVQRPSHTNMSPFAGYHRTCNHCNTNAVNNNNNNYSHCASTNNNNNNSPVEHNSKKVLHVHSPDLSASPNSRNRAVSPDNSSSCKPSASSPQFPPENGSPLTLDNRQAAAVD